MYLTKNINKRSKYEKLAKFFDGHILSHDEMRALYEGTAWVILERDKKLSKEMMQKEVGFSLWNWFTREWGDYLRSKNGIDFYYYT